MNSSVDEKDREDFWKLAYLATLNHPYKGTAKVRAKEARASGDIAVEDLDHYRQMAIAIGAQRSSHEHISSHA